MKPPSATSPCGVIISKEPRCVNAIHCVTVHAHYCIVVIFVCTVLDVLVTVRFISNWCFIPDQTLVIIVVVV